MQSTVVLVMDVGGTNIRLAVVDAQGGITERTSLNANFSNITPKQSVPEHIVESITDAAMPLLEKRPEITAVGIGFPGFFELTTGNLISSPNIPGLHDFPLAGILSKRLRRPVHAQNDASLAALGEFRFGGGQSYASLLHLTLGTGIGGGLIINNMLYTGDNGMAMEIGHLQVAPADRLCGCGARGCLETWASATAVSQRFTEKSGQQASAREVCQLASGGDKIALQVLHDAGTYLGVAIAESVKLLDVCHVSISGGLTGAWEFMSSPMHQALQKQLIPPLRGKVQVHRSILDDDAGILGAAALALDSKNTR